MTAPPDHRRFPVLRDQLRCATGATFVAGGVLRALSSGGLVARRVGTQAAPRDARADPPASQHWLYLRLHELAARGAALPSSGELARYFGVSGHAVGYHFQRLVAAGLIDMATRRSSGKLTHRIVRLRQSGAVLRTAAAPDDREV